MLTTRQRRLARHALGLDSGCRQSYRNRYLAPIGSRAEAAWDAMVAKGAAVRGTAEQLGQWYRLTPVGAAAAIHTGERLDPEDFPEDGEANV